MFLSSLILNFYIMFFFFFSSRRRHTRFKCDWSSDVCLPIWLFSPGAASSARAKSAAAELKFPLLNSLSPTAKSSDVCAEIAMEQTQATRNETNTRIPSSAAPPRFLLPARGSAWFIDLQNLIRMNIFQYLHNSARPTHLNLLHYFVLSEPKVHTLGARRKVATRRRDCRKLCSACGHNLHFSANSISIALVACEFQQNPVILRGCLVMKHVCRPFIRIHNCIHAPVVVQISGRHSARHPQLPKYRPRLSGHVDKTLTSISRQQHRLTVPQIRERQLHSVQIVPLRNQQVFPPVIVVVQEPNTPSRMGQRHFTDSRSRARIRERAITVVSIQRVSLICQVSNHNIRPAIIVIVCEIHAHACIGSAVNIHGNFGWQPHLFKRSISLAVVQKLHHRIVGHKQIDMSIAIIVRDCQSQTFSRPRES